jgi:hypothetical protein
MEINRRLRGFTPIREREISGQMSDVSGQRSEGTVNLSTQKTRCPFRHSIITHGKPGRSFTRVTASLPQFVAHLWQKEGDWPLTADDWLLASVSLRQRRMN